MKKINSDLWNTFLCNRLSSLEANIRTSRTVRLGVMTVAIALIGVGKYLFDLPNSITYLAIAITIIWYFTFSVAFFKSDHVIKKYENLILKNIKGELTKDEIFNEYKDIQDLEKILRILILKGRFWRYFIKLKQNIN